MFSAPCGSREGADGWGVSWDIWGHRGVTTCTRMHAHTHKHMYRNCKWPPTWRHPCLSCLTCMCVCVCMHAHACAWTHSYTPIPTATPSTHSPPPRRTPRIGQNSITLDLIEIIQFCLKIYDLLRHPHLWVGVLINGWVNGWFQVKWLI